MQSLISFQSNSVNREKQEEVKLKVWAKSDIRFKSYEISMFKWIQIMRILELATLPISVMSLWRSLHGFCTQNLKFFHFSWKVKILTYCLNMWWLHKICKYFWKNYDDSQFQITYRWKNVRFCVFKGFILHHIGETPIALKKKCTEDFFLNCQHCWIKMILLYV